jgi:ATP-binding cassette, subfamily A (ABC1), member 3
LQFFLFFQYLFFLRPSYKMDKKNRNTWAAATDLESGVRPETTAKRADQIRALLKKDILLFRRSNDIRNTLLALIYFYFFTCGGLLPLIVPAPKYPNQGVLAAEPVNLSFPALPQEVKFAFAPCQRGCPTNESLVDLIDEAACFSAYRMQVKLNKLGYKITCFEDPEEMNSAFSEMLSAKDKTKRYDAAVTIPQTPETDRAVPFNITMLKTRIAIKKDDSLYDGNLGRPVNGTRKKWVDSHFVRLQHAVQSTISEYLGKDDDPTVPLSVTLREAPFHSYLPPNPQKINILSVAMFMPLLAVIMEISRVLEEKKKKLHEHICNSTGVSVTTLGLSNFAFASFKAALTGVVVALLLWTGMNSRVDITALIVFVLFAFIAASAFVSLLLALVSNKTAGLAISVALFFAMAFAGTPATAPGSPFAFLGLLFPGATFHVGLHHMQLYSDKPSLPSLSWTEMFVPHSNVTYGIPVCLLALVGQTVVYLFLGLYAMNTVGGNGTTPKPCCGGGRRKPKAAPETEMGVGMQDLRAGLMDGDSLVPADGGLAVEAVGPGAEVGISIQGLRKDYGEVHAVDGLTVDMYRGEITALLGHNGAGKTTTMQILTGGVSPTAGDATVLGHSIVHDLDTVRKNVAICPQHNVLWDNLTVAENIRFFADLQRTGVLDEEIESIVRKTDLVDKADTRSKALSGGMKRKLCVGMALIGRPRVLILDEPTAGLDPESRRAMWDMLQLEKKSKTIVLCTHHMEEADLLGDRVVVMAHGKLQVAGSSVFLKQKFGIGYNLAVEVKKTAGGFSKGREHARKLVRNYVQSATVHESSIRNANEVHFDLPLDASVSFPALFAALEKDEAQESSLVVSYGLTMPSLEEVFLKLADLDHENCDPNSEKSVSIDKVRRGSGLSEYAALKAGADVSDGSHLPLHRGVGGQLQQMQALGRKRILMTSRDKKSVAALVAMPLFYILYALVLVFIQDGIVKSLMSPGDTRTLTMDARGYGGEDWQVSSFPEKIRVFHTGSTNQWTNQWKPLIDKLEIGKLTIETPDTCMNRNSQAFAECMLEESDESIRKAKGERALEKPAFAGLQFSETSVNITYNTSFLDSPPILVQWVGSASLRNGRVFRPTIKTVADPFESNIGASIINVTFGLFIGMMLFSAYAAAGGAGAHFVATERSEGSIHTQRIAGVSTVSYLVSTILVDLVQMIPAIVCTVAVYIVAPDKLPNISILQFILVGLSMIPFGYVITSKSKKPAIAQQLVSIVGIALFFIAYFALTFLGIILRESEDPDSMKMWTDVLDYFFYILSPPSAFAVGFDKIHKSSMACVLAKSSYDIKTCTESSMKPLMKIPVYANWKPASSWDGGGAMAVFLLFHTCLYCAIKLFIDYRAVRRGTGSKMEVNPVPVDDEDEDVRQERLRIDGSEFDLLSSENFVTCKNLKKRYPGAPKTAVDGVSFAVQSGTCFALLGPNGAGKSTTMNMMTGLVPLGEGDGYVGGKAVSNSLDAIFKGMGYCPQHGGLFPKLNVREHFEFYCDVRGMGEGTKHQTMSFLMKKLGLDAHAEKLSTELSGGNKRKLAMAIAMVGKPDVLLLDEPTAGVDPGIRRNVVEAIHETKENSSVILTTHIMEEVEALASSVGIMVNGRLKCLGSLQHLVSRFGTYYVMEIRGSADRFEEIRSFINKAMPSAKLNGRHFGQSTWHLPKATVKLSAAFKAVEGQKKSLGITSYAISQLSLEQLFLKFAKQQRETGQGPEDA